MGLFVGTINGETYEPSLLFRLLRPALSGNSINGHGDSERRKLRPVYHNLPFGHPWFWAQWSFYLKQALFRPRQSYWMRRSLRLRKEPFDPVAPHREEDAPENWARRVKETALAHPAIGAVGIARMDPEWVYEGDEVPEPWLIVLGSPMDYGELSRNLEGGYDEGNTECLRVYYEGQEGAVALANWIRQRGWHARGLGGPMRGAVNLIPAAIAAGLGQLGKHGSMMNDKLGSCFRLSYVLTDMPLVADAPRDIGVDDFCRSCQLCLRHCPTGAIYPEKQMVRGELKWYVDFDKCVPFFNEWDACGVCLSVCPWSRPGVAEGLVRKMLRRRASADPPESM